MKVAFVSQPFEYIKAPIESGSIPIWTYQVIKAWPDKHDQFTIYSNRFVDQSVAETIEGVEYKRFSTRWDLAFARPLKFIEKLLGYPRPKRPFFSSIINYFGYALQISLDLRKNDYDIVHVHNFSQFVPIIRYFNPRIKIVLHMHCEWLSQLDHKRIEHRIEKTDLVIGCSEFVINKVKQRFPEQAEKAYSVYNGVNLENFSSKSRNRIEGGSDNVRLLYVGRVSPEKGIHILLDAFLILRESLNNVQLDIVGSLGAAPYEYMVLISDDPKVRGLESFYHGLFKRDRYYSSLTNQLLSEVAENVNFVGAVPHSEVVKYYHQADVLVNPSFSEAFGMSLVEALACQVPIVASRIGGMIEIIEDSSGGFLVEAGDANMLADAISAVILNDDMEASFKPSKLNNLHKFTWLAISENLHRLYTRLLNNQVTFRL